MTHQTVNEDDVCRTCGKTFGWHIENTPVHPFNYGQSGATDFLKQGRNRNRPGDAKGAQETSQGAQIASMTTDPVLRIALVNAGVITPTQLVAAEESLRLALNEVMMKGESNAGEVRDVAGR